MGTEHLIEETKCKSKKKRVKCGNGILTEYFEGRKGETRERDIILRDITRMVVHGQPCRARCLLQ